MNNIFNMQKLDEKSGFKTAETLWKIKVTLDSDKFQHGNFNFH